MELGALAQAGASTIVTLAATEGWTSTRRALSQLLARENDRGLDTALAQAAQLRPATATECLQEFLDSWLREDRELVAVMESFVSSRGQQPVSRRAGPAVNQKARADGGSVVVQAGNDASHTG